MSSHERGRDYRRRRYNKNDRDRENKEEKTLKRPVILTKAKEQEPGTSKQEPVQPTILLKNKDSESKTSPISQPVTKKSDDSPPNYHIAAKPSPLDNPGLIMKVPDMISSVKLVNENGTQILDELLKYLTDQTDFLVIGCMGLQGSGKSTLLSHIAQLPTSIPTEDNIFKIQTKDQMNSGMHCTEGIDAYVTPQRVILLDCQPVLSLSLVSKSIQAENSRSSSNRDDQEFQFVENELELQSLQLAAFLLSVCHLLLVVQDSIFDPDLIRFLLAAEILKPPTLTTMGEEEFTEYFPHLMLVHTKTQPAFYNRQRVQVLQDAYRKIFASSNLQVQSGIGIANGNIVKTLTPTLCGGEALNLYLLPPIKKNEGTEYKGHLGYLDLMTKLRQMVYGLRCTPITHTLLTEKNWWHYAVKVWEGIRKSPYFPEYMRHLPTSTVVKVE